MGTQALGVLQKKLKQVTWEGIVYFFSNTVVFKLPNAVTL